MTTRWMLSEDGVNFTTEFHPLNGSEVAYTYDRELSSGQIFFRQKLNADLQFGSSSYKSEYDYFWNNFRQWVGNTIGRCGSIYIRQEMKCERWKVLWTGEFSTSSGHFDMGRCVFSVRPVPLDKYTCIMRRMETKYNVLTQASETLSVPIMAELDIVVTETDLTGVSDYELATSIVDGYGCTINVWWREIVRMPCASGSPSPPSTPGWTFRQSFCNVGYAIYSRSPTIPWTFGDPVPGTWGVVIDDEFHTPSDQQPPDSSCKWVLLGYAVGCYDGMSSDANLRLLPYYMCPPVYSIVAHETSLARGRDLGTALTTMYAACGSKVVSDFLELNPAGDAPGYSAGINYVTGETNQVANLKMFQLSDVVMLSTNPATIGETTLKDLLTFLQSMRLFWDIDDNGDLRIEHWIYWQGRLGLDIIRRDNTEAESFLALDEKPASAEVCTWEYAKGEDFIGKDIIYSPPCASEETDKPKRYDFKGFVTDLPTIIETRATNAFSITKNGFLIVACEAGTTNVTYENGLISSVSAANMHLSWANLHDHYWRYDRLLPTGNMNGRYTEFDGFVPNIRQDEFSVELCCDVFMFNPRDSIKCKLSNTLSKHLTHESRLNILPRTQVKRAQFKPSTGWVKLSLLHSYG